MKVDMRGLRFGQEVEMVFNRRKAAHLLAEKWGTTALELGTYYDKWACKDPKGRKWVFMSDGSVHTLAGEPHHYQSGWDSCEMVTPLLGWDDLPLIREAVDTLRAAGAYANSTCGVHVHVDGGGLTPKTLKALVNLVCAKEDLLEQALGITPERKESWCKPVNQNFLRAINEAHDPTMDEIERLWYTKNRGISRHEHYDPSRYHLLNLHSLWQGKGVEYRAYNGTLDPDELIAYIHLCTAVTAAAESSAHCSPEKPQTDNPAYTFRCWLLRLELNGEAFKSTRRILLEKLPGNAAWRSGAETKRKQHKHIG